MILWGTGIVINPLITFWVTRRHTLTITQTHDDSFYMYTRFAYMVDVLNIHGMQLSTIRSEMPNISLSPDEISNRDGLIRKITIVSLSILWIRPSLWKCIKAHLFHVRDIWHSHTPQHTTHKWIKFIEIICVLLQMNSKFRTDIYMISLNHFFILSSLFQ